MPPPTPEVDDLRLVLEVCRRGSIGAAAQALGVAQPSASTRLSRLERRCGVKLFDRDTTGTRPTAAGVALAAEAEHVLAHLAASFERARAASRDSPLVVGTFASLTSALFPALDALLPDAHLEQRTDHGHVLMQWVAEGTMDAAFVAIADQVPVPRTLTTHVVGDDELVLLRATEVPGLGTGRTPLRGRDVVFTTYDTRAAELRRRLERLGATARPGITMATTLAMARRRGHLAVVPRTAAVMDLREDEVVEELPFRARLRLSMVTPHLADARLLDVLPRLRAELGLHPVRG